MLDNVLSRDGKFREPGSSLVQYGCSVALCILARAHECDDELPTASLLNAAARAAYAFSATAVAVLPNKSLTQLFREREHGPCIYTADRGEVFNGV